MHMVVNQVVNPKYELRVECAGNNWYDNKATVHVKKQHLAITDYSYRSNNVCDIQVTFGVTAVIGQLTQLAASKL